MRLFDDEVFPTSHTPSVAIIATSDTADILLSDRTRTWSTRNICVYLRISSNKGSSNRGFDVIARLRDPVDSFDDTFRVNNLEWILCPFFGFVFLLNIVEITRFSPW